MNVTLLLLLPPFAFAQVFLTSLTSVAGSLAYTVPIYMIGELLVSACVVVYARWCLINSLPAALFLQRIAAPVLEEPP